MLLGEKIAYFHSYCFTICLTSAFEKENIVKKNFRVKNMDAKATFTFSMSEVWGSVNRLDSRSRRHT